MLTPEQVAGYQDLMDRMGHDHLCNGARSVPGCDPCRALFSLGMMYPGVIDALLADRAEIAQELERIRCGIWHQQTTELALTALIERIK